MCFTCLLEVKVCFDSWRVLELDSCMIARKDDDDSRTLPATGHFTMQILPIRGKPHLLGQTYGEQLGFTISSAFSLIQLGIGRHHETEMRCFVFTGEII